MTPFFMANTELGVTVEARQKLDYQSTESEGVLKVAIFSWFWLRDRPAETRA
jgi:hypothetical protein